jgi:hypothetical protein
MYLDRRTAAAAWSLFAPVADVIAHIEREAAICAA